MKQHVHTFINTPKLVAATTIVISLGVGAWGYYRIHNIPTVDFAASADQVITGTGTRDLTLGFVAGGRIATVSVKTGDVVKKGDVLATIDAGNAVGALSQARAAYTAAQANYQKIINGATGAAIDVAKAALNTATVNLAEAKKQQSVLVANAHRALLNSTLIPRTTGDTVLTPPTISGTYTKDVEGVITITTNQSSDGGYFTVSGLVEGTGSMKKAAPQPLGDSGLFIQFSDAAAATTTTWTLELPNTTAPNYLTNYNAYQQALQTRDQVLATAQAAVDQAQANLTQLVTAARPEDVATAQAQVESARGALEIAQAAYSNTIITAPENGTITNVLITAGQIAASNAPAIEILLDR